MKINWLWLPVLLCMAVPASWVWGGLAIYENGAKIASCEPVAPPASEPVPDPPLQTESVFTWSHETRGDNAPLNPQPLYDQTVLSPGQIYLEVLVGRVHHVVWYNGDRKLRTERFYPYTHWGELSVGTYDIVAEVYSDDTTVIARHRVLVYVADGGADAGGGSTAEPAEREVIVQWEPPTLREDGSPLSPADLAEYRLYVNTAMLPVASTETSTSLQLPAGDYRVTITAVDLEGLESKHSDPVLLSL